MSHDQKSKNKRHRHKIVNPVDATVSAHFLEWRKPLAKLDPNKLAPVRIFSIFKNDTHSGKSSIILSDLDISSEFVAAPDNVELDKEGMYTPEVSETGINVDASSAPKEVENGEYKEDSDQKTTKINKADSELDTMNENKFPLPHFKNILQDLLQTDESKFFVKASNLKRHKEEESNRNEEISDAVKEEDSRNAKIKGSQLKEDKIPMMVASGSHQLAQERIAQRKEIMDNKISKWLENGKKSDTESSEKITPLKNELKQRESSHKVLFPFNGHREHKFVSFDDGHGMQVTTANEPVYLHTPTLKEFKDRKELKKILHIRETSPVRAGKAVTSNKNKHEIRFDRKPIKLLPEIVQKEKAKPLAGNQNLSLPASRPAIISRIDDRVPIELVYKIYTIFH